MPLPKCNSKVNFEKQDGGIAQMFDVIFLIKQLSVQTCTEYVCPKYLRVVELLKNWIQISQKNLPRR